MAQRQNTKNLLSQLGAKRTQRYNRILDNRGNQAAQDYLKSLQSKNIINPNRNNVNVAPNASQSPYASIQPGNIESVLNAAQNARNEAVKISTPNLNTHLGNRQISYDSNGNPVVNETLSQDQMQLYNQNIQLQNQINQLSQNLGGLVNKNANINLMENNPFQLPSNGFNDIQQNIYKDTLASYDRDTEQDLAKQRENLQQFLLNSGNPVNSPAYNNAMDRFENSANKARENVRSTAYRDSIGAAQAALQSQLSGNEQVFNQRFAANQLPYQQFTGLAGLAGRYSAPQFGAVQSINAPMLDVGGISAGIYGENNANQRLQDQLASQMKIEQMRNATSRATAGAGSIGLGGQLQMINARAEQDRITAAANAMLNGIPRQPGISNQEIGMNIAGSFINGITAGLAR